MRQVQMLSSVSCHPKSWPKPHLNVPPSRVLIQPEVDVVLQSCGQAVHEGGAGGDGVGVKGLALDLGGQLRVRCIEPFTVVLFVFPHVGRNPDDKMDETKQPCSVQQEDKLAQCMCGSM